MLENTVGTVSSVRALSEPGQHNTRLRRQRSTRFAGIDGNVLAWARVRPGADEADGADAEFVVYRRVSRFGLGRLRNSGGALVLRRDTRLPGHLRFAGAVLPLFPSWEHATRAHAGDREEPSGCVLGAKPECQSLVTALVPCDEQGRGLEIDE
jgi:hypothetical protein